MLLKLVTQAIRTGTKTAIVKMIIRLTILTAYGCGPAFMADPAPPQIDAPNCVTTLETAAEVAGICAADHTLVLHCGAPEAQPSDTQCSAAEDGTPRGLVWCCLPAFAAIAKAHGLAK